MGLLTEGTQMSWSEILPIVDYIKEHGIAQFIYFYNQLKTREDGVFRWGDEIEYIIVKFDDEHKKVRVSLRADDLLKRLQAREEVNITINAPSHSLWRPEFASYMIEGTPGVPYGGLLACLNQVESNMARRRTEVAELLHEDEVLLSISYPALGTPDFTDPAVELNPNRPGGSGESIFIADEVIFGGHSRFRNIARNIRDRRGEKLAINVPIFRDANTPSPFKEVINDNDSDKAALTDHIFLDHMCFGTGLCCLQITFQAANVEEARLLHDQLTPITPILLALSAATPIFCSHLSNVDCRWDVISQCADDRTAEERGKKLLNQKKFVLPKSRYDTSDYYLHPKSSNYNDIPLICDEEVYRKLLDGGVDEILAKHVAHLFVRDPLQVFKERVEQNDHESIEHFETIQSSNWMNMRFKPPPLDCPDIGWRVECRPTEVQLTDFENAAFCCFVVLLTRVILSKKLSFLMPISQVNENFKVAQKRNAVLNQKFHFPSRIMSPSDDEDELETDVAIVEMSANEIINGDKKKFLGLVPIILNWLKDEALDDDTRYSIEQYLKLISKRASGEMQTLARWMREFVRSHKDYKYDSHVSDEITYDMLRLMDKISKGEQESVELLGGLKSKSSENIPPSVLEAEELNLLAQAEGSK